MKCEYVGCTKDVVEPIIIDAMNFCEEHDKEFTAIVRAEPFDPGALLNFWVKCNGKASRLAEEIAKDVEKDLKQAGIL